MMKPTVENRPRKGASYPTEFRDEAVRYSISSGKKAKAVAAELGVTAWSLQRWRDLVEGKAAAQPIGTETSESTPAASALELTHEVGRLRRGLEAMTCQRDI